MVAAPRGCPAPSRPPPSHLCKGAWALGSACGKCDRCLRSAADYIIQLRADLKMYQEAWLRELGGLAKPKAHLIDALVLTTREMRMELYARREAERLAKAAADLAVRYECEASWRAAMEEKT